MGPAFGRWPRRIACAPLAQRWRRFCASLLLFACSACSNSQQAESSRRIWVGALQDSDAMVGVVESAASARLFVCGGPSSLATQTHWFTSSPGLGSTFSLADGGFRVEGATSSDQVLGLFSDRAGDVRSFSARRVAEASLAGVYDAFGPCGHLGLIIQPNSPGDLPRAQGACLETVDDAEIVEQVNPVMPIARDLNAGVAVTVGDNRTDVFTLHPLASGAGS